MIRCVRMWTGPDGNSTFEEGMLEIGAGAHGKASGLPIAVRELSFQETGPGAGDWHRDPVPQYVLTLSGTIAFEMESGASFTIHPGDVLIAQDNAGTGHRWRLIGDAPWRRAYVVYQEAADLRFMPTGEQA
jgi:quercetin dioxygenase-like cupin family protein